MTINEIKKLLYKEKPVAYFQEILKGVAYYRTCVAMGEWEDPICVYFQIPISDMGDACFSERMDAQLLNRWIVKADD